MSDWELLIRSIVCHTLAREKDKAIAPKYFSLNISTDITLSAFTQKP
jgi:hypothetical protein